MGFFDFFKSKPTGSKEVDYIDEKFLQLGLSDYFGEYAKSPNGRWVLSWRDANSSGTRGGFRNSGPGQYLVLDTATDKVTLKGKLQRPNSGSIADSGRFSLEDWLFGNGLKGKFYVFAPDGTKLLEKKLEANIFNSAISPDGRFAVCQTANAGPPHGNRLFVFDVDMGAEVFSLQPSTGWADSYKFSEDGTWIAVIFKEIGEFKYNMRGEFVEEEKYHEACLKSPRYNVVLRGVDRYLNEILSPDKIQSLIEAVDRAKGEIPKDDNQTMAWALKLTGHLHEKKGALKDALDSYDAALKLNPKVGVKRAADAIRKKLKS